MAMHLTPEEHDADPPSGWTVHKVGRRWELRRNTGGVLCSYDTKTKAEQDKVSGPYVKLYEKEGRWFSGELVANWKPYRS